MTWHTIYAPHEVDQQSEHYAAVKAYMLAHGSPRIRAWDAGDHFEAIEGSHRLAIAAELGIPVRIVRVEYDQRVRHDVFDLPARVRVERVLAEFSRQVEVRVEVMS